MGDRKKLTNKANMSGRSATWEENVEFVITGGERRVQWLQVLQCNACRSVLQAVVLQGIMLLQQTQIILKAVMHRWNDPFPRAGCCVVQMRLEQISS